MTNPWANSRARADTLKRQLGDTPAHRSVPMETDSRAYPDFVAQFQDHAIGEAIVRAMELAMRLPPGIFAREELLQTVQQRRYELFAEILADETIGHILK